MRTLRFQARSNAMTLLLVVLVAAATTSSTHPPCFHVSRTDAFHKSAVHQPIRAQQGSRKLALALFSSNNDNNRSSGRLQMKDVLRPSAPPSSPPPSALTEWAAEVSLASLKEKLIQQPIQRIIPLITLISFVGYVFISPFAPGPVPNMLDPAVLKQVGGLTLNYFCILPTLLPSIAPKFSPVMEGVFNLLLAYAALLSGFLVDGRKAGSRSSNVNFFLPFAAAGLALTNTAFLPYLVLRPLHKKDETCVRKEDVPQVELQLGEAKKLLAVYGLAGLYSVWWGFFARPEFGGLSARWASLIEMASTDRLMFAFCVEAVLFWVFQGWLVDDDMMRRTGAKKSGSLGEILVPSVAKVVPFVGLFMYMMWRPPLMDRGEGKIEEEGGRI
ncbi:hypothetical protein VYU27_001029 [Nannochloropsis oceanica]